MTIDIGPKKVVHPRATKTRDEYDAIGMLLGMHYDPTSHVFIYPGAYREGDFKDADTLEVVADDYDSSELNQRRSEFNRGMLDKSYNPAR